MEKPQQLSICPTTPTARALAKTKFTHKLIGIAYFVSNIKP